MDAWFEKSQIGDATLELVNPRTRRDAESWLTARIERHRIAGRKVLVGFDFAFGYPSEVAGRLFMGLKTPWSSIWSALERTVLDDANNDNNRFAIAAALNQQLGDRWFWGGPAARSGAWLEQTKSPTSLPELRVVDQRVNAARNRHVFSARQLFGNGSVGSQVFVGLPVCQRLRATPSLGLSVWPFDTGLDVPGQRTAHGGLLVEIWPGVIAEDLTLHNVRDAAQMLSYARWAASHDVSATLGEFFTPSVSEADRIQVCSSEGWILGA